MTTAEQEPADTIRRAADLMRTRAAAATRGTWTTHLHGGVTAPDLGHLPSGAQRSLAVTRQPADAEHIAGMDPLVAEAVAAWLDEMADCWDSWTRSREHIGLDPLSADPLQERPAGYDAAWTVARTYLGEAL